MTLSAIAFTDLKDSRQAGWQLGADIAAALPGVPPDALIVFASSQHDYPELLKAIQEKARPKLLIGCSSAGEFTSRRRGEGAACALALCSDTIRFTASVGRALSRDYRRAAEDLVSRFGGVNSEEYPWRTALVFIDPLAGHGEHLVQYLTLLTGGRYQFVGGGAGDDAKFQKTHVFYGNEAIVDAVVALEILSKKPVAIGAAHGWKPATPPMRVTASEGSRLISLDAIPAAEIYEEYAENMGERFDRAGPLPFFLHNILGIDRGDGKHRLRVPLLAHSDGAVTCAAEVPCRTTASIMKATSTSAAEAARRATVDALQKLEGATPKVALFFDCVATRLRMGKDFGVELTSLQDALRDTKYVGFNTYGQIVRTDGQFNGFHNCTAVVCVLSD